MPVVPAMGGAPTRDPSELHHRSGEARNSGPTTLYNPNERPSFLISEALRGYGAVLKTLDGNVFMDRYDPRGSLATRDIVARAIDNEMKIHGDDHVYLDARHLDPHGIMEHFPNIYEKCKSLGIDITKDLIPVTTGAHFMCGGIRVDRWAASHR